MTLALGTKTAESLLARWDEDWSGISPDDFLAYFEPKTQEILTLDALRERLGEDRPLRVKLGIDPTGAQVHLGHVVPIMLLRQLLKAGHRIDLIIGDFTARVGDPSGRDSARTALTTEQIDANKQTYVEQISRFLDVERIAIHHNATWLAPMRLDELFPILQEINLSVAMQREDFRARATQGEGVSLAEACYGILMALDSIALESDIEVGGIDQLLNFQQCRGLMRQRGLRAEIIAMTPILEGTAGDGRKMSKSYGNYIAVEDPPAEVFGKIMSIPDSLLWQYYRSFADVRADEEQAFAGFFAAEPLEAKKQLGSFLVAASTGRLEEGLAVREEFERKFAKRAIVAADLTPVPVAAGATVFEALAASGAFQSRSELRRLFQQDGVRALDDDRVIGLDDAAAGGMGVRVGKRRFFRLDTA